MQQHMWEYCNSIEARLEKSQQQLSNLNVEVSDTFQRHTKD